MLENNNQKMGLRDGLPIGIGYFAISFAVGFFASSCGLPWFEAFMLSVTNFTMAGEIAAIPIIAAGGSLIELALTQLIINSRYAIMSISLSQRLSDKVRMRDRFLIAFFNSDEIFALVCAKESLIGTRYIYALAILPYLGWIFGTLIGAVLGALLPTFLANALSVGLYAMLISIIMQASKESRKNAICVATSIAVSCAFAFLPVLKEIDTGIAVVIITVALSSIFALVAPIPERDPWKEVASDE